MDEVPSKAAMEGNILVDLGTEVGSLRNRREVRHNNQQGTKLTKILRAREHS